MTPIEPSKQQPGNSSTTKKYPAPIRVWHWLNALVISGSLITVLINSTVLKSRQMAPVVQQELQKDKINLTVDQSRAAIHVLSDKVWELHIYFGYFLAALLMLRMIAEFLQLADNKFTRQIKNAWQQFFIIKKEREKAKHDLVVKALYLIFYILLVIMVSTGLSMAFDDVLGISKNMSHTIKEIHNFCMYPILAFIVIHIAGVILAERKDSKGIVSDMINGG